jgi:hypothetical protein
MPRTDGRPAPAILNPALDAFFVGGGWIAALLMCVALRVDPARAVAWRGLLVAQCVFNFPHFMASYGLLYGSAERRHTHRWLAFGVPALLLVLLVGAVAISGRQPVPIGLMHRGAMTLLAWHYTGQAWGMMAAFATISGRPFAAIERRLIRTNLYALMTYHVAWALLVNIGDPLDRPLQALVEPQLRIAYQVASWLALGSTVAGIAGLTLYVRRARQLPPARVWIPWVAVHLWYVAMAVEPRALLWVQIGHAAQYLIFPIRVELNRDSQQTGPRHDVRRMVLYVGLLLATGYLAFMLIPDWVDRALTGLTGAAWPGGLAVLAFLNIHHYCIDNRIWKLRRPEVRASLLGHLQAA